MIPLRIQRDGDLGYSCTTDAEHFVLGHWLESDVGIHEEGNLAEDLFEEIGGLLRGDVPSLQIWGNSVRLTATVDKVLMEMPRPGVAPQSTLTLSELVESTLRWFDVVNPPFAERLREIRRSWPVMRS
jgi:hypothetical protein